MSAAAPFGMAHSLALPVDHPRSFEYSAETLASDGKTWQLYLELFGTRSDS